MWFDDMPPVRAAKARAPKAMGGLRRPGRSIVCRRDYFRLEIGT